MTGRRNTGKIFTLMLCTMMIVLVSGFYSQVSAETFSLGTIQELTPTDQDVLFSAWSPDGNKIAYVKRRSASEFDIWDIWVKEIGGADPVGPIAEDVHFGTPLSWSADGTRVLFFTVTHGAEVKAADTGGGGVSIILSEPGVTYAFPNVSNNKLVCSYFDGVGRPGLFYTEVNDDGSVKDGTEVILVAPFEEWVYCAFPRWGASDNTDIITFSNIENTLESDYDVYVLNGVQDIIAGNTPQVTTLTGDTRIIQITDNTRTSFLSSLSFDERLVFYTEDVNDVYNDQNPRAYLPMNDWVAGCDFDLLYMNADGTGTPQKISDETYNQAYMIASPEGTRVSFIANPEGDADFDIFIASLVTSNDIPTGGGTVTDGSGTTVDIPNGALTETTTVTIETPTLDNTPPSSIPLVTARDFGPDGLVFDAPVTITINYTDASVAGFDESSLQIYYYNESTETWESLGGTVDMVNNTVSVAVNHFSLYAVAEGPDVINATVDIVPDTLNLKIGTRWMPCYIELPESYDVEAIDGLTVEISIAGDAGISISAKATPQKIGDYDDDGIPDLAVRFDRHALIKGLYGLIDPPADITLTVTGEVDGLIFEGSDTVEVKGSFNDCFKG